MIGEIDKLLKPKMPSIYLCKPNRERIALLKEAKSIKLNLKYNDIHEITFELPYKVRKNNKTIDNDHVDLIRGRFILEVDNEFFIISKYDKKTEGKKETMSIHGFHLPYELKDKDVRVYKGVKTLSQSLTDTLLAMTEWTIDYIDSGFDVTYREFDVTGQTLLQFIFDTAKKFRAVIYWNSKDRKISFYKQENLGIDKGLFINDKKYLKEIMETTDFESVCTRLRLFGKDGLSINRLTPTGENFIENFSYFMYPYEEDENGNIINHSRYMTDGLCKAIIQYSKFIESKTGEFKNLLEQKSSKQVILISKNNELFDLEVELALILDNLATANATGQPNSALISQKNTKESQISSKKSEINGIQSEINGIDSQINNLRNSLNINNFFTQDQIKEKNRYEIYRTFDNQSYFDDEELYEAGIEELNRLIYPPVNISANIVNFLRVVKCQRDWDKLKIGDIITLAYPNFGIHIKAKVHEISIDFESNDINIVISDFKRLLNDKEYFNELIYRNTSTSSQINMNKQWWETTRENNSFVRQLLEEGWNANKLAINAGIDSEVSISNRGLIIKSPDDAMNYLVARHGILAITNDGGNTWKNAITKNGIIGERIIGQIIAGEDLTITTGNGDFTVNDLGVTISGTSLTITGGLPPNQLDPTFKDSLVELNKNYTNGIRIDSANGIVVTRSDDRVKTTLNASDGIKIQNKIGSQWYDAFKIDTNGNASFKGIIEAQDIKLNGMSILNNMMIKGDHIESLSASKISAGTIDANTVTIQNLVVGQNVTMGANARISWDKIDSKPTIIDSNTVTTITRNEISTATIRANQILIGGTNGVISFNDLSNKPFIPSQASHVGALPVGTWIPNDAYITQITKNTITTDYLKANFTETNVSLVNSTLRLGGISSSSNKLLLGGYAELAYNNKNVSLSTGEGLLTLSAFQGISMGSYTMFPYGASFSSGVDFSGATVTGLNITARFG